MHFVLFTKTNWDEPPRLRHQIAELLAANAHTVTFFERPAGIVARVPSLGSSGRKGIHLRRTRELLLHQFRVARPLSALNAAYESRQLRKALSLTDEPTVILNFNYDYYFLPRTFPGVPLISIFNDDFIAAARLSRRAAAHLVGDTARASAHNLTVSYPLLEQIRQFTDRVSLFLPWARNAYRAPAVDAKPDGLLYWGYVNDRIDAEAVTYVMSSGIPVHFVGPTDDSPRVRNLLEHRNATYHGTMTLAELDSVVERCVASILPYDTRRHPGTAAATMSNRGFDILSRGLPLIYSDLPALLSAPDGVIYRCASPREFVEAYEQARSQHRAIQPAIREFLAGHTADARYLQLMELVSTVLGIDRAAAPPAPAPAPPMAGQ